MQKEMQQSNTVSNIKSGFPPRRAEIREGGYEIKESSKNEGDLC